MTRPLPLVFALPAILLGSTSPAAPGASIHGRVIVVDDHGKAIDNPEDVYVYLEDVHASRHRSTPPGHSDVAEISQHHQQFEPHVLVVSTGTTVSFPNLDAEEHNVFSPDPFFDLGRYNTSKTGKSQTFTEPGQIEIYCDIHKEMWARLKVVDSKIFVPLQAGTYSFDNVPVGTYKVVAWMPDSTEVKSDEPVTIDGATTNVQPNELHLQRGPKHVHHRKHGEEYQPY